MIATTALTPTIPFKDAPQIALREAWGNALVELGAEYPDLLVLDGDLANSTRADIFAAAYPNRFFEMGIAEQNLIGAAAGLATLGFVPWISTFAAFVAKRDLDQIRVVVDRSDLHRCKFVGAPSADQIDLQPGQALLRVASFAFTANNVTYAVAGDMLSYWSFFPAESGWGRIPVWGFAEVIASRHDRLSPGTRVFGYLPMSTHLVVEPEHVTRGGFVDASPHRAALPLPYNQYTLVAGDPSYDAAREAEQMLFRPLFTTSFLLDDFLADNGDFGAEAVVLASASSKTAYGLAFLLSTRTSGRKEVIGLTSAGNAGFVRELGCYDRVVPYADIASLPQTPATFVDMAGDAGVVRAIHQHYRNNLKHSCSVGLTHWENPAAPGEELPGPTPTFFFAPTQLEKRRHDWGLDAFQRKYAGAWQRFLTFIAPHLQVRHGHGPAAVEECYRAMLEGRATPREGHILSLWPAGA